jgi:putative ABC transport system permease protein
MRAPRLARAILSRLLPLDARAAVLRDLDDEYARFVRPSRGGVRARLWYWQQVAGSIGPARAMRRRRQSTALRKGPRRTIRLLLEQVSQDLRIAARGLRQRKAFTAAAVVTLALGIGANTAIFSLVDAVILRPLPYPDPGSLLRVWSANPRGFARNNVSPPDFFDFRDSATGRHAFQALAAYTAGDYTIWRASGTADRLLTSSVSSEFFAVLGVSPHQGRALDARDTAGTGQPVVVVSHEFWRTRLAGRADVIGSPLQLESDVRTIVGVMPASFAFPSAEISLWLPLAESTRARHRTAHYLDVVGRVAPGVTHGAATETLRTIAVRIGEQHQAKRGWSVTVTTLHDSIVGDIRRPLLVLLAIVGCVMLVACANVANLLLARGVTRGREIGVRAALGATRARLVGQQLAESFVLTVAGGTVGVGLAWLATQLFLSGTPGVPRASEAAVDVRVLSTVFVTIVAAALLTGLLPALAAGRRSASDVLSGSRVAGDTQAARRTRSLLVVAEVAVTLALVVSAGLLGHSFLRLVQTDPGFKADQTLVAQVSLSTASYQPEAWTSFVTRSLDELRTIPGVLSVGAGTVLPLSGQQGLLRFGVRIGGRPDPVEGQTDRSYLRWITPGYVAAMGIPVLAGRDFDSRDTASSSRVAIVDRAFVERYFSGEHPIGRHVRPTNEKELREIIGVVESVRQARLEDTPEPHLYVPFAQNPIPVATFVVRSQTDAATLTPLVRAAMRRVDPTQPIYNVRTLRDVVDSSLAQRRMNIALTAAFAALATILMVVGVYGLIAGWISESSREIGVRIALGAATADVLRLVVGRGLRLAAAGTALGLALAFAATRVLESMLFGVAPRDPIVFAVAGSIVLLASALASYIPARRAIAIDPASCLKLD